jgi:hypothetical protein
LADTDTIRKRVKRASICAYRAALEPIWYRQNGPLEPPLAEKMRPLAKRFFMLCDQFAVDRARESREDIAVARGRLKRVFGLGENDYF